MRRLLIAVAFTLAASPSAWAQQSFNLYLGGFTPKAEDARIDNDVLVNDLTEFPPLFFDMKDFNTATFGAEYLVGLGDRLEAGLGIGYQQRSVPSIYSDLVNANGSEIEQTLKLRIVPFTATVRVLPFGHHAAAVPYIGAGVGVLRWRYSETGQFVDCLNASCTNNEIFRSSYVDSGSATGPVILGGVRVPLGDFALGFELRHQSAEGELTESGFVTHTPGTNPKIDLGGFTYSFTVNVRF